MSSGVAVAQDCVQAYSDLKLGHKYRYFVMRINDNQTEVIVEKTADPNATYDDFLKDLPATECRYAVYDLDYETKDGRKTGKVIFFVWAPDEAKIKAKMITAASKAAVKKALTGISCEIQATGADEIEFAEVLDRARS